jgi:GAF domain-containing protein
MISLVEAVTDYAAISLVNARLFRTIQESAEKAQSGEKEQRQHLATLQEQVRSVLTPITYPVELLLAGKLGKISIEQKQALKTIRDGLKQADQLVSRR